MLVKMIQRPWRISPRSRCWLGGWTGYKGLFHAQVLIRRMNKLWRISQRSRCWLGGWTGYCKEDQSKVEMYRWGGCRGCRTRPGQDVEKEVEGQWWISQRSTCRYGRCRLCGISQKFQMLIRRMNRLWGLVQGPGVDKEDEEATEN